jgi:hypothetical protein
VRACVCVLYGVLAVVCVPIVTEFLCLLPLAEDSNGQTMYELVMRALKVIGVNTGRLMGVCTGGSSTEYTPLVLSTQGNHLVIPLPQKAHRAVGLPCTA